MAMEPGVCPDPDEQSCRVFCCPKVNAMPVITPEQMYTWTDEQRERACDWARANGLNPNDVTISKPIEIGEGAIAYHRFVRDERGHPRSHPTDANETWTEPEIARYLVELPDGL